VKEYWAFVMSNECHAIDLIGLDCESEEHAKERARLDLMLKAGPHTVQSGLNANGFRSA
jgi:hypothetical protein